MKRLLIVVAALFAFVALASHGEPEGAPAKSGDKSKETVDFIFHHVADSDEFEYELPWEGGHLPAVHIGEWFGFLKFGTCGGEHDVVPGFEAFPSLGGFLHGCYDLRPTKGIFMMWLASGGLFLLLVLSRKRDQNGVPRSLLTHVIEVLALFVRDEIATPNLGKEESKRYTPYLISLFFFILAMNWLSLIPGFFAGTSVLGVTAALAIITFLLTQIAGIRAAGLGGYLAHLTGGVPVFLWPIMIPVELMGLFTKPFALLIRLFANMVAGHLVIFFLLALIFMLSPAAVAISLPVTVAVYMLEIFVGILQAYIFTLLTALFIGQGVAMGHHHDEKDAHAH